MITFLNIVVLNKTIHGKETAHLGLHITSCQSMKSIGIMVISSPKDESWLHVSLVATPGDCFYVFCS